MQFLRAYPCVKYVALAVLAGMTNAPQALAQTYTAVNLGTLSGGTASYATGINNLGQVVGYGGVTSFNTRYSAFLYSNATLTNIGTLGGNNSRAYDINDSGQIVGYSSITGESADRAFLYNSGSATPVMQNLGTLGGTNSSANAINNSGQITGAASTTGNAQSVAFLYTGGTMQNLGVLDGRFSSGNALTDDGRVVGESTISTSTSPRRAFLYDSNSPTPVMQNLGTLGGTTRSRAYGINSSGGIVGNSAITGSTAIRAFFYDSASATPTMQDLGTLPGTDNSYATAINASGQIVGLTTVNVGSGNASAFLYSGGVMKDINTLVTNGSGISFYNAVAINDAGQIAVNGVVGGVDQAFLLTPVVIPEAGTLALLGIGCWVLGVGVIRRRKRAA